MAPRSRSCSHCQAPTLDSPRGPSHSALNTCVHYVPTLHKPRPPLCSRPDTSLSPARRSLRETFPALFCALSSVCSPLSLPPRTPPIPMRHSPNNAQQMQRNFPFHPLRAPSHLDSQHHPSPLPRSRQPLHSTRRVFPANFLFPTFSRVLRYSPRALSLSSRPHTPFCGTGRGTVRL